MDILWIYQLLVSYAIDIDSLLLRHIGSWAKGGYPGMKPPSEARLRPSHLQ